MTPYLDEAVTSERLAGGTHHAVWLARQADGVEVVVKATPGAPAGMFEAEAEGLSVLRESGAVAVPRVIDVGDAHLVLEALRPVAGLEDVGFWAEAGRSLARLHAIGNDRFGWHRDNWLGPTPQINTWSTDGYAFFAEYRVLHYLAQPAVPEWLDDAARAGVERICARLPQLVPPSRPALTHGDLWPGNMLATHAGEPALIDPAVSWNWPDADTSMMFCAGMPVPDAYFDAYHEIRPADPDWRDHLRILHLRELLCLIAQRNPLAERAARAVLDLVARYG